MSGEFPGITHTCVVRRIVCQYDDCIHFSACQGLARPPGSSPDPASPVLELLFHWTKLLWVLNQILYNQSPRKLLKGIHLFYSLDISTRFFSETFALRGRLILFVIRKSVILWSLRGGQGLVWLVFLDFF